MRNFFTVFMGKMAASYRLKMVGITDSRIRIMNELVQGIQIIKMYAWERPFAKLIDKIRKYVTLSPKNKYQTESLLIRHSVSFPHHPCSPLLLLHPAFSTL